MNRSRYWIALAAFLGACQIQPQGPIGKAEAIAVANRYVGERFAPVPPGLLRVEAEDRGSTWRVTFNPPEDSVGGPLRVDVDKQTRRVVGFAGEQ